MSKTAPVRRAMQLGQTALTTLEDAHEFVVIAKGFRMTVNGLRVTGQPSLATCQAVGVALRVQEKGAQFALGDYINYVEERFGEEAAQILDAESGWSAASVTSYRWIASRIAPERRRMDRLGIRHHLLVAALTPTQQEKWLTKAANEDGDPWTVKQLKDALSESDDVDVAWWALVHCSSAQDQTALMAQLEQQGRTVKALQRRGKKKT